MFADNPYWLAAEFDHMPDVEDDCQVAQLTPFSGPGERSGSIVGVSEPVEALGAFVETRSTWPKLGYVEFVEPDGAITYGSILEPDIMAEPDPDNGLVIAVSMDEVEGG